MKMLDNKNRQIKEDDDNVSFGIVVIKASGSFMGTEGDEEQNQDVFFADVDQHRNFISNIFSIRDRDKQTQAI